MAVLIPSLASCLHRMQAGERRFARRLESHLEDDYLCWYEVPLGGRQRYSDFIVLHPNRGLLLLEVKDWKLDIIHEADKASFTLLTERGLITVGNPLEQVRQCTYALVNRLKGDPQLISPEGRHRGQLAFPYGFGVVLTNSPAISSIAWGRAGTPAHQVISDDTESCDVEAPDAALEHVQCQLPGPHEPAADQPRAGIFSRDPYW